MMRLATKASRAARNGIGPSFSLLKPPLPPPEAAAPQPLRHFSVNSSTFTPNPVVVEMIKYATSLARGQKTEESYARGLLVLEQCESTQPDDNSKGLVELARSTLLFERGSHEAAIERLGKLQDLNLSSVPIKVAASEALEEAASAVADLALQILGSIRLEIGDGGGFEVLEARIKALKGLIELICGNLDSGNAALSYGEFFHGTRKFSSAKELYSKVIQEMSEIKDFCDPNNLGACNMTSEEVAIAAACALGQLEAHMGNFNDAEEILTAALKKMEERFGPHHPKVGVILTCIALMYRLKAMVERSSSLLIQEGLFRRAIELLKAPPLEVDGASENVHRKDIITLARGMS
ncbi:hypothetical protein DH2020_046033 [Rehmannia glutinosa]|uniref:Uncharacterized protein n=1 Tax=Rehmannia glutinosa TaxID=99300 RepID=A0ABR0UDE6_REHGL